MEPRLFQALVDDAAEMCGAAAVELHALPALVGRGRVEGATVLPPFAAAAVGGSLLQPKKKREEVLRRLRDLAASGHLPGAPTAADGELRVVRCADQVRTLLELGTPIAPGQLWCADAPLVVSGTLSGVLRVLVEDEPRRSLYRALRGLGHQAALQLGQAVRRRDAQQRLERARTQAARLAGLGLRLLREADRPSLLRALGQELQAFGAQSVLLLLGPDGRLSVAHLSHSARAVSEALSLIGLSKVDLSTLSLSPQRSPHVLRLLESEQPTRDVPADRVLRALLGRKAPRPVREAIVERLSLQHLAAVPLPGKDAAPVGLLFAALKAPEEDLGWLAAIAVQAGLALERLRVQDELREIQAGNDEGLRALREQNERLLEHDKRKDNFLANVSHELRSPMVTTLGYTDLLLAEKLGPLSDKQRQCLSVVKSSGRRLKAFIEELLDFSRFELTRETMSLSSFDVREAIAQVVAALHPRLAERRINVEQRVPSATPLLRADRDRILQVLTNLVTNAEKHVPDGGRIQLAAEARGGEMLLVVLDNGTGIPSEHQAKIFDRLYQVGDVKDGRQRQGLGLGLNIVKSIVDAHGGTVSVQSAVGKGSKFTVTLPLAGPLPAPTSR